MAAAHQPAGNAAQGPQVLVFGGGGRGAGSPTDMPGNEIPMEGEQPAAAVQPAAAQGISWVGQQQNVTPELAEAQGNYIEELKKLTEMLAKVSDQSERLTRDSEEMENLNRTLTGITKIYEMQLKGASQQIGTIEQINDQSRKMAQQIEQLNAIYKRMIEAMTVNMQASVNQNVV